MISSFLFAVSFVAGQGQASTAPALSQPGELLQIGSDGKPFAECPLRHTTVNADVAGFGARVSVVQTFQNTSKTPIEAIYTFPLPHEAAVDRMRIMVGSRVVDGMIRRRDEARQIYDAAKAAGQTAALLDEERPNIFTQSVANIMPGAQVQVEIGYVEVLKYEHGEFEFNFPMVVGPRYLGRTPDPQKVSPPITPPGTRTGAAIDLTVRLDAGAPIKGISSLLHPIDIDRVDARRALITLQKKDEIPNRDFILHYATASDQVQSAFLTTFDPNEGGYFNLILMPPRAPRAADVAPREMIFVMDQSGSQSGFPIAKSKELTYELLKTMRPNDTFNVYGFNLTVRSLWPTPQPVTPANLAAAHKFLDVMVANGGTNLLDGMHAALAVPKDPKRLRVVLFNTDGYVGDEPEILQEIRRERDQTRIFTFGIGNSVNRYLIDAMSLEGRGDSEMVTLASAGSDAADRFTQRLRAPILTDIKAEVAGVAATDVLPREIPDVFSDRPIVVQGRYAAPGDGRLTLTGRLGGRPWTQTLDLHFGGQAADSCISTLWARRKVDDLTDQATDQFYMLKDGEKPVDYRCQVRDIGLEYGIMTPFTSFVAVAPEVVNIAGEPRTVHVPVDMADGVSYDGIMGSGGPAQPAIVARLLGSLAASAAPSAGQRTQDARTSLTRGSPAGAGGGLGGGGFGGQGGGGFASIASPPPAGGVPATRTSFKMPMHAIAWNVDPFAAASAHTFETVVDPRVRRALARKPKTKIAVVVFLKADDETAWASVRAALTIGRIDRKSRLAVGEGDAAAIRQLASLDAVTSISPAE